jgi:hypothetical protein
MLKSFPVIWALHGQTRSGKLEVSRERMELSSRGYTFGFARNAVAHSAVERGPDARIRGLPAITVRLAGGEVVRFASLGGAGSLHEVAALLALVDDGEPVRRQELSGAGT